MPKSNAVRNDDTQRALIVKWKDGSTSEISWGKLRDACPCAECATLRVHDAADPLRLKLAPNTNLVGLDYVGNYAVQPRWGDGHSAGLFTWNYLRDLAGLLAAPQ
ncbi:MAG: DUF971 domain-containing protein [Chloroflexi bacterium]|nr:DUF971 domain-containing protein [Chloroflexota bacterium]